MVAPLDDVAGWSYARTMGQELCVIFFPCICVLVTLGFDLYVAISVSIHFTHCEVAGLCGALQCSLYYQDGLFIDQAIVCSVSALDRDVISSSV